MTSNVAPSFQKEKSLFDFLYLDRKRLASYVAQLISDGNPTLLKRSSSSGAQSSMAFDGGIPGLAKGGAGSVDTVNESVERQFDTSWSAPLDMLRMLSDLDLIQPFGSAVQLGHIVLFKGSIQVFDLRVLQKLWQPFMALEALNLPSNTSAQRKEKQSQTAQSLALAKVIENMPHSLQLRAFSDEGQLWATMDPESMTVNPADLAFKYGPWISGRWAIVALVDAKPNVEEEEEMIFPEGMNQVEFALAQFTLQLKHQFGRSYRDYGVTPLAIYRQVLPAAS